MANELYIYTTPHTAHVQLRLDSGQVIAGTPCEANGRDDAHLLQLPAGTPSQGSVLEVSCEGYQDFANRGLVIMPDEATEQPLFILDDIHLIVNATANPTPPEPGPPPATDPLSLINAVYATGQYTLATKDGCGTFTEACCKSLHDHNNQMWGHISKSGAQNQWNGHAVDAVQCLAGEFNGIWDIIHDSESPNGTPSFNYKGVADPALWYYPA